MRRKAATVPASKAVPGLVYAYRDDSDKLVRFRVSAVVTRRTEASGSPHDYKSTIEGYIIEPGFSERSKLLTIEPNKLLGLYDQHLELVAREQQEMAERKRKEQSERAAVAELRKLLYQVTDLSAPSRATYAEAFYVSDYGGDTITINRAGVVPLIEFLKAAQS